MNNRERLFAESLAGHDGSSFARAAAAHARRRHMARQGAVAGASTIALAAALLSFMAKPTSVPPPLSVHASGPPGVEILSDDDLLQALRKQPVLVLRDASGITGVVFLDPAAGTKL